LITQLFSYLKNPTEEDYDLVTKELISPKLPLLSFILTLNYKVGSIFYIKKLFYDLKGLFHPNHLNFKNKSFCAFYL
jgi:hypothetical protein